jgi:Cytotoxic
LPPIPIPSPSFVDELEYLGAPRGRRRYRGNKRLYEWDSQHGELEVYDTRGNHLGVADVYSGEFIKPAVHGRRIQDV